MIISRIDTYHLLAATEKVINLPKSRLHVDCTGSQEGLYLVRSLDLHEDDIFSWEPFIR